MPHRRIAVLLCILPLLALPSALPAQERAGALFIVGGGPRPDSLMQRFVDLAGGARARILVLPMASADAAATGESHAEGLRRLGASATSVVIGPANAADIVAGGAFDDITGIWLPGGVQSRLMDALAGNAAAEALRAAHARGVVIGGTSAGAAVMTSPMIVGDERRRGGARPPADSTSATAFITIDRDNIVTTDGLGLLPDVIVDQHFVRRKRNNRLISTVLDHPGHIGVGIDEGTAVIVRADGMWEVAGESVAVIYDAREARTSPTSAGAADLRVHVLPAGSLFDPRTGRASLPPR